MKNNLKALCALLLALILAFCAVSCNQPNDGLPNDGTGEEESPFFTESDPTEDITTEPEPPTPPVPDDLSPTPIFILQNDGTYGITIKYAENLSSEYTVPATYEGKPVTAILEQCFMNAKHLEKVVLPDSITTIGNAAFHSCTALTEIKLPVGVTSIGASAFNNCVNLTEITLPSAITHLEQYVFSGCTNLVAVTLPNALTYINESAFNGCTALSEIQIPDGVIFIGAFAFSDCISLTEIRLPAALNSITGRAFFRCDPSLQITVSEKNPRYRCIDGNLIDSYKKLLIRGASHGRIPSDGSVTAIGSCAYYKNTSLTSVSIPGTITRIQESAFDSCENLEQIHISEGVTAIERSAFSNCKKLTEIHLPDSVVTLDYRAFNNCTGLQTLTLSKGTTNIGSYVFNNCTSLSEINIPEGVTNISSIAFYGCTGVKRISISSTVTSLDASIFSNFTALEEITVSEDNPTYHVSGNCLIDTKNRKLVAGCNNSVIPDDGSVTVIGQSAFVDRIGLQRAVIPSSVTVIESGAFSGCTGISELVLSNQLTAIQTAAFFNCTALRELFIPASVQSISESAFSCCASLEQITVDDGNPYYHVSNNCLINTQEKILLLGSNTGKIPDDGSVEYIGIYAFRNCSELTEITIPDGVKKIGNSAFFNCSKLTEIVIPKTVTEIGINCFAGCSSLRSLVVEAGNPTYHSTDNCLIYTASKRLIAGCSTSVIPKDGSVTYLEFDAFLDQTALESIVIPKAITRIGETCFRRCNAIAYYEGTSTDWKSVEIPDAWNWGHGTLDIPVYCYSEEPPTETGLYWHYVDGVPTPW